jgi:hypothetical protein
MLKILKNQLEEYGYNAIALPKEGIHPLLLLYKNSDAVSSTDSDLFQLFGIEDAPPPPVLHEEAVAAIVGSANLTYSAESGVSLLDWLTKKLNLGKLGANIKLNGNYKVQISYEDITEDKVSLLALDNFISGSAPDVSRFNAFKQKLENSELYVVSSVLKSSAFSISVLDDNGQEVDADVIVKNIADIKASAERKKNKSYTLKNENAEKLAFAFKAQRIIYDKKSWWQFFKKEEAKFRIKDQQGMVLKNEDDYPTNELNENTSAVDL